MYLAGSITLWKKEFEATYSPLFKKHISLFEPGKMNIPHDHRKIRSIVAKTDVREIRKSDAVLVYMKEYTPEKHGGPVGTDSSWECGFAHGLKKPLIVLIDSIDQVEYYKHQWMVTYHIDCFVATEKKIYSLLKKDQHFKNSSILFSSETNHLEKLIYEFVKKEKKRPID
jgi:nucleoside 2-deoxyribosyltransferase